MDKLPKEILLHMLTFADDPARALENIRSTSIHLHKALLSIKNQYVIKALPTSALEQFSMRISKATKPFELIVRSPPLALQKVPNKFMNSLTSLKNLTGLDITDWKQLPIPATLKIHRLKNLESLAGTLMVFDVSPLSKLTKLSVHTAFQSTRLVNSLTNLRDLKIEYLQPEDIKAFANLPLTKLHFGFNYNHDNDYTIILTNLTNLKDLKIKSEVYPQPRVTIVASCTTLESLYIGDMLNNVNVDWIASNKNLTAFHVRCSFDDPEKYNSLTNLRGISSARLFHPAQVPLFRHLTLTSLDAELLDNGFAGEDVLIYTSLRSLKLCTKVLPNFPPNFPHLTQLTLQQTYPPHKYTGVTVPTDLKELVMVSACAVQNLTDLTKLEYLALYQPPNLHFDARPLKNLTKFRLHLNGAQQAVQYLPKLSNLFSLKELQVIAPNNYQGVNAEFLTTLTNLEKLDIAQINLSLQVFNKLVLLRNNFTELRVNCSESNGEILTRLTNLQILHFFSQQPVKGLKTKLEEQLPRLVDCQF